MENRKKIKGILSRIAFIALGFIAAIFCFKVFFVRTPLSVAGYSFFIVSSGSMEPEYPVCTLVVIKNVPFEGLKAGDAIVYRSDALGGGLAFHRIERLAEGGKGFYTKGDNNSHSDNQLITASTYVGKGVFKNYFLGFYISSIQNPAGFVIFFVAPIASLFLLREVFKRIRLF